MLAAARKLASDAMFAVAQGIDPIDAKREQKQAAISATEGTLNAIAKQYLKLAASKLRSHGIYQSISTGTSCRTWASGKSWS